MKIRDILHDDTRVYKILPLWARIVLDHIHELQVKIEKMEDMMMTLPEFKLKKYQTPWGDFDTYGEAARAMPLEEGESILPWTEIRSRIKSDEYPGYYFNE